MSNPNDITAEYYERANEFLKNATVLEQELALVRTLVPARGRILDIGCGTGRHLIPLLKEGYQIKGVDSSIGMLKLLKDKEAKAEVYASNIFDLKQKLLKVDLILMFWNTFNEIALKEEQALGLLELCHNLLKSKGKILINIDDTTSINPREMDFSYEASGGKDPFHYYWEVIDHDPETITTVSRESIKTREHILTTLITQRWWSREQMHRLAEGAGFKMKEGHIKANSELYLILSKNGK